VAGFTTGLAGPIRRFQMNSRVRTKRKRARDFSMTFRAGLVSDVAGLALRRRGAVLPMLLCPRQVQRGHILVVARDEPLKIFAQAEDAELRVLHFLLPRADVRLGQRLEDSIWRSADGARMLLTRPAGADDSHSQLLRHERTINSIDRFCAQFFELRTLSLRLENSSFQARGTRGISAANL